MNPLTTHTVKTDAEAWDEWNLGQAKSEQTPDRPVLAARAVEEIQRRVPTGRALLDIGIGAGFTTDALASQYAYSGLDISERGVAEAQRRNPTATLQVRDFLAADFGPESFDGVLCVDALAYMHDQKLAVQKMANALKPGGTLVLTMVNPVVYSRLRWVKNEGPPKWFRKWLTEGELCGLVESAGLSIESSYTIEPTADSGWLRVMQWPRRVLGSAWLRLLERWGLGRYRVVVARKVA